MEIWRAWLLRFLPTPCPLLWEKQGTGKAGHWGPQSQRPEVEPRPPCPLSGSGKPGKRLWVPPGLSTSYFRQQWPRGSRQKHHPQDGASQRVGGTGDCTRRGRGPGARQTRRAVTWPACPVCVSPEEPYDHSSPRLLVDSKEIITLAVRTLKSGPPITSVKCLAQCLK